MKKTPVKSVKEAPKPKSSKSTKTTTAKKTAEAKTAAKKVARLAKIGSDTPTASKSKKGGSSVSQSKNTKKK